MCDERTEKESEAFLTARGRLSRRRFAALTGGAGMAALFARPAHALDVAEADVSIKTPDGAADCYFAAPAAGTHPGIVMWPDIMGLRPAFRTMGKRLAESGYAVVVINPFYRKGPAPVVQPGESFQDPAVRQKLMGYMSSITPENTVTDATALLGFLDQQKAVDTRRKIGTVGYCMGGPMTIRTAAVAPDRIGAAASCHGARLVTKDETSPHLLIPKTKASYLFAIAENDDKSDPEAKAALKETCEKAGRPAEIEVYAGTMHGWCVIDSRVYDQPEAERAWSRVLALFGKALA